jgi:hypothetical protein
VLSTPTGGTGTITNATATTNLAAEIIPTPLLMRTAVLNQWSLSAHPDEIAFSAAYST